MEECRTGGTGGPSTSTCARVASVSVCVLAPRCPRKAVTSSANPTSSGEVESHFESWWLTVNSSPSNTRPHPAADLSFPPGGLEVEVLQRENYYVFSSCLRRCGKGWRCKSHSKALRDEIAEVSTPCSFPPSPPTPCMFCFTDFVENREDCAADGSGFLQWEMIHQFMVF